VQPQVSGIPHPVSSGIRHPVSSIILLSIAQLIGPESLGKKGNSYTIKLDKEGRFNTVTRYAPKLLRVDLTTGVAKEESIPEKTVVDFVGGRGLGVRYLYDELSPHVDPLGSKNKLLFTVGPLAGTGAQSFSRWMVTTKSPLTGTYCRSVGGADFGAWLKFAGLDMIIVEGKADEPVYLFLEGGRCQIKDAAELWGMGTKPTQLKLKDRHGKDTRIACIGPAGEKLVRYASILSDERAAARAGVGTVMGSKNLKAIAIKAEPGERSAKSSIFKDSIKNHGAHLDTKGRQLHRRLGTLTNVEIVNKMGFYPTRNFREGRLDGWEKLSADAYAKIKVKNDACYGCPVQCGKTHRVNTGPYAGADSGKGPEYETTWAFSGAVGSNEIGMTIVANALCNDLGLDTISTGNTIGFAYELFEKGMISSGDTNGLDLTYGNHEACIELIKRIGNRQGFGDVLAEGTKRAAKHMGQGAEAYAMQVKGLELAGYDPRGAKRHGLGYATSSMGGSHQIGYVVQEIFGHRYPRPVDRFADEGDVDILIFCQDNNTLWETGISCGFTQTRIPFLAAMLASVTGISELGSVEHMLKVGERIFNLEKAFNLREGFDRKDDNLPLRMTTEPLINAGPSEGQIVRNMDAMLDDYYSLRGWDENGVPKPEKLRELGLEEIIEDIRRAKNG
jgi:aldehyde:ferredoxin oxidoreductase